MPENLQCTYAQLMELDFSELTPDSEAAIAALPLAMRPTVESFNRKLAELGTLSPEDAENYEDLAADVNRPICSESACGLTLFALMQFGFGSTARIEHPDIILPTNCAAESLLVPLSPDAYTHNPADRLDDIASD